MAFADLSSELTGNLPGLSPFLADTYINRAWEKIRRARLWSFLIADDTIVCPAQITSGSFAITQYSDQVTADATASAAISALNSVILPPEFLQLRFQAPSQTSQIYRILEVDDSVPTALVYTLDRVVVEATDAASDYICYRPYVQAPSEDFLTWISIDDMTNGIAIQGPGTTLSSGQFDRRDPQRQAFGQALYCGFFQNNSANIPLFEFWPGPTMGQNFHVTYRRRGTAFSVATDAQPANIPDSLIIQCALAFYAYPFAAANVGHFPSFRPANWAYLIADSKRIYQQELIDAKRNDDEVALQTVYNRGHGLTNRGGVSQPGVADAKFWQSHPVTW